MDEKRLFFGFDVEAPWPELLPKARHLDAKDRHITVAFLGQTSFSKVEALLSSLPKPPFLVGKVGLFSHLLFFPPERPRVVTCDVALTHAQEAFSRYQKELSLFLKNEHFKVEERKFIPHVTLGRAPFDVQEWKDFFFPLPFYFSSLHLYESLGHSTYTSRWEFPILPPFIEIEHAADIAFKIHGESKKDLHLHAQFALCFQCPELIDFLDVTDLQEEIEDIVIALNHLVMRADQTIGTPFKAVSFHGEIEENQGIYTWEMIVDV